MKRFFAILISVLLLAALAVPALASGTPRFYLTGPSSAKAGDTVKIAVNLSGSYTAHIINLKVGFDPGSFSYSGYTYGSVGTAFTNSGMAMCNKTADGKAVSYGALAASDPVNEQGVLVELTFTVLGTAASNPKFTLSVEEFSFMPVGATNSNPINHTAEGMSMTVTGGNPGGGTTPTQGPGGHGGHGGPGTLDPVATPDATQSTPVSRETPDPNAPTQSPDANVSEDPAITSEMPDGTEEAEVTPEPEDQPTRGLSKTVKTVFIAIVCVLAAVLALVIVLLVLRAKKENNKK